MTEQGIEGLMTFRNPTIVDYYKEIVALADQHRLPAVYGACEFVLAGGLASYGPNIDAIYIRLASFVDKLLKGARADELPIEQPTTFELVLNRRAASSLGMTLPPLVIARADRIID
jgi:putative tryptophan/tyrosine transport system substrate-binding protein